MFDDVVRDIKSIELPRWGRVLPADGVVPWLLFGPDGEPVEPVRRFLMDFVARDNRPSSVRSYAYGLLRWWRWLLAVGVEWDKATPAEMRDLVLWLQQAAKPRRHARTASTATAGRVNPVTRKRHLGDRYEPRTIRHSNAVIRSFYEFWIDDLGGGPLINPVQLAKRRSRGRPNAHHNPLEPFRSEGRIRYNPKIPKSRPPAMSEEQWRDLFAKLRSNRDRALLALAVSNAARAEELLGMQTILGHEHLSTTADIYLVEDDAKVISRVATYLAGRGARQAAPPPEFVSGGYKAADLDVLLGGTVE